MSAPESPYIFNVKDVRNLRDPGGIGFHKSSIRTIAFSPTGAYVATGDDKGYLVVRYVSFRCSPYLKLSWQIRLTRDNYPRVRVFKVDSRIRSIVWHPVIHQALLVGCGNGSVHKIRFDSRCTANEHVSWFSIRFSVIWITYPDIVTRMSRMCPALSTHWR